MNQEDLPVIIQSLGGAGLIVLNRPQALNALNLEMLSLIRAALDMWLSDDQIRAVVFTGAGERAFCAGGDIKAFYQEALAYRAGKITLEAAASFFDVEYALNRMIFHYPKPTIAIMDGIVMGGGYGIAGHCRFRVATDRTVFAMPEVGIGFFPDVGSLYHLLSAPGFLGHYLALTGESINGSVMLQAGLANSYINSIKINNLIDKINKSNKVIDAFLNNCDPLPKSAFWKASGQEVSDTFAQERIQDITKALRSSSSEFAKCTLQALMQKSPTSISLTAEYLRRAKGWSFDRIIETDYRLAQSFIANSDMVEGIRAQVIDKDRQPRWNPKTFEAIEPQSIERFFEPDVLSARLDLPS